MQRAIESSTSKYWVIEMPGDCAAETGLIDAPMFADHNHRSPEHCPGYRVADLFRIKILACGCCALLHLAEFVVTSLAGFADCADFGLK